MPETRHVGFYLDLMEKVAPWMRRNGQQIVVGQVEHRDPEMQANAMAVYNDGLNCGGVHGLTEIDGVVIFVGIGDNVTLEDDGTWTITRPDGTPSPPAYRPEAGDVVPHSEPRPGGVAFSGVSPCQVPGSTISVEGIDFDPKRVQCSCGAASENGEISQFMIGHLGWRPIFGEDGKTVTGAITP